jgi:hypothetical protein
MQLVCEGHPQIENFSQGMQLVLNRPTVLEEPVGRPLAAPARTT